MSAIERLKALPRVQQLVLALGGSSLLFLFLNRKSIVAGATQAGQAASQAAGQAFDFAKAQAFNLALPAGVAQWSTQILNAARQYNVDPFVLAGIMYNESLGGAALTPPGQPSSVKNGGPAGTGDFIKRGPTSSYWKYANPATGLPTDGLGWGRGLMQVDFGVHNAWVIANNWRDPQVNINKAASILADAIKYFSTTPPANAMVKIDNWRVVTGMPQNGTMPWNAKYPGRTFPTVAKDPRPLTGEALYLTSLAAYNAGYPGPLQAVAVGLPAEAVTANQDYTTRFMKKISVWQTVFGKS